MSLFDSDIWHMGGLLGKLYDDKDWEEKKRQQAQNPEQDGAQQPGQNGDAPSLIGSGQTDSIAQTRQKADDYERAAQQVGLNPWVGLGLMGFSMLANNRNKSFGELIGQGGLDGMAGMGSYANSQLKQFQDARDYYNKQAEGEADRQMREKVLRDNEAQRQFDNNLAMQRFGLQQAAAQREAQQAAQEQAAMGQLRGMLQGAGMGGATMPGDGSLVPGSNQLTERYESAGNPGDISLDTGGSKSYGRFQFNTSGTAQGYVASLAQSAPELYQALGGGRVAVGSRAFDNLWNEAAKGPLRDVMARTQAAYLNTAYVNPTLNNLSGTDYMANFGQNPVLRDVITSTAVQHGPGAVRDIFDKAWGKTQKTGDPNQDLSNFIANIYGERVAPGRFETAAKQDPDIYNKMARRYQRENADAQAMLRGVNGGGQQGAGQLPPEALLLPGRAGQIAAQIFQEQGAQRRADMNMTKFNAGQNNAGKVAFDKGLGKNSADDIKAWNEASANYQNQLAAYDALDRLYEEGLQTGWGQETINKALDVANRLGIDTSGLGNATTQQGFQHLVNNNLLQVLAAQKGVQSEQDAQNARKTWADWGNTQEANQWVNQYKRNIANRGILMNSFLIQRTMATGNSAQARLDWNEYSKTLPSVVPPAPGKANTPAQGGKPVTLDDFNHSHK